MESTAFYDNGELVVRAKKAFVVNGVNADLCFVSADFLSLTSLCREAQLAVTIEAADRVFGASVIREDLKVEKPSGAAVRATLEVNRLEAPSLDELQNWSALIAGVGSDHSPSLIPKVFGDVTSVTEPTQTDNGIGLTACPQARTLKRDFRSAVLRRESAKGFLPLPLTSAQVLGTFLDGTETLTVDCARPEAIGVGVRLLVRRVEGLDVGLYTYSASRRDLLPLDARTRAVDEEEALLACMGQPVVRHAAAIVALHAPVRELLHTMGRAALTEVHFHASHVAQKLCLGATRKGAGVTCIGGFDERRCSDLFQTSGDEEVVYLLALGIADPNAVKLDRARIAYSHARSDLS